MMINGKKNNGFASLVILFLFNISIFSQSTGSEANYELRYLIDQPTTGVLKSSDLGITLGFMPSGGLLTKYELALFKNFSIGLSYGASNFIGSGNINWNKRFGINSKLRLLRELRSVPSITIGVDTQGKGKYLDSLNRYEIKSPGVYLAISKNYKFLGYLSFHGLVNYSLEQDNNDESINFGIGLEKTIGPFISILSEYDFGINDNSNNAIGKGRGYLNLGIRWAASNSLTLGVDFRNLLENKKIKELKAYERSFYFNFVHSIY